MAEPDTVSNTSSTLSSGLGDVVVLGEDAALGGGQHETDADLQEAAGRLETSLRLQPDADITQDLGHADSDSIGAASTSSSSIRDHHDFDSDDSDDGGENHEDAESQEGSEKHDKENGMAKNTDKANKESSETGTKPKVKDGSKKSKNPLKMLRKLTKFDKPKKKDYFSEFEQVKIDKLPQVFVAKYLGMREVRGFCGLHHVRKPVDEMVARVQKSLEAQEQVELPLMYVVVSPKGLDVREHKLNKQKEGVPAGLIPIDFISYGVQDIRYWRVFTFIVVREMSSRSKVTECHAYLCDSSLNARKMALSLGASFRVYARSLKKDGKVHNFQVELRPPDELAEALTDKDCDA